MTAVQMFITGTTKLGTCILTHVQQNIDTHIQYEAVILIEQDAAYHIALDKYNAVMAPSIPPTVYNLKQIEVVLKPLETKDGNAMLPRKADVLARYMEWSNRRSR